MEQALGTTKKPWLVGFFGFGLIVFIQKARDIFNFESFLSLKINLKFNIIGSQLAFIFFVITFGTVTYPYLHLGQ